MCYIASESAYRQARWSMVANIGTERHMPFDILPAVSSFYLQNGISAFLLSCTLLSLLRNYLFAYRNT